MPVERHIYKVRAFECLCGAKVKVLSWDYDPVPQCPSCSSPMTGEGYARGQAPAVHGDEIDVTIEHGVCHADGTPRRFRSKTELRQAELAAGLRRHEPGDERLGADYQKAYDTRKERRTDQMRRILA